MKLSLPKIKVSYNEDIRRVPMISNEFILLQKQVRELFEFKESFVMKYKDDEGDMISICTEEELKEAMLNLNNGILRIYIEKKKEKRTTKRKCNKRNKSPQQATKERQIEEDINPLFLRDLIHEAEGIEKMINHLPEKIQNFYQGEIKDTIKEFCPYLYEINFFNDKPSNEEISSDNNNVKEDQPKKIIHNAFCDRCDEKIVGLRYKCFECEDFDLCEDCHKVAESKEDIKTHLKTHRFGKMDTIFSTFGFQQEREDHLSLLKIEKEKQEKERIEKEKKEKEKLEKENQEKLEKERIEKEQQEKERNLLVSNESNIIPFDQKLDILSEMGFSDRKKNIQVLIKHKGNLNNAVQDLINFHF